MLKDPRGFNNSPVPNGLLWNSERCKDAPVVLPEFSQGAFELGQALSGHWSTYLVEQCELQMIEPHAAQLVCQCSVQGKQGMQNV